jgi:hypothetical protein
VPINQQTRDLVAFASDNALREYYELKLIQPSWRQLLFTEQTGPVITHTFTGPFTPRSIVLYNPTSQPVYVSTGGINPLALGIAIEPQSISPRLPIPAADITVGLDPATVDLTTTQYLVHLFRFATPD